MSIVSHPFVLTGAVAGAVGLVDHFATSADLAPPKAVTAFVGATATLGILALGYHLSAARHNARIDALPGAELLDLDALRPDVWAPVGVGGITGAVVGTRI